ncbi:zeta toxin family protein (plasmid) [Streptomyces sp. NBC_01186]|uniref:zeta toxin family protein n=1 Tax=Streptomyces sp. NBC_01186 TaxID=2903765 RepID=UPI002E136BDD|nr:zeta toxin family protein [Streptomyces sp. NBC_01186]
MQQDGSVDGPAPDALTDRESLALLRQVILPAAMSGAVRQERPVVVVVGGQPGAGKTQIADLLEAVLRRRGGAVRVGRDLYKAAHPGYLAALAADVRTAGAAVREETSRWQTAVEDLVRERGFDAVVESALADIGEFRASAATYREAGARLEVVAVATPEALSQLGILDRFLSEPVRGGGRYVSWDNHDTCAQRMPAVLAAIEAEQLADRVTVLRRDGTVLYANELVDGAWSRERPAAARAVTRNRARPWSAPETAVFRRELARTDRRLHRNLTCDDRRLAVQRDVERAAAWAEPVRRIAQPRRQAPGVDYHRLSAEEHRWVFEELITPSYLSGIVRRDDPCGVYVLGQPGAGKLLAARMVKRAVRPGTAHLLGDDFKASHPDYLQLLTEDPRNAGAAIRADYRAWFAEAEEYVRRARGDVLIEGAPGSTGEFLDSALPFAGDGYPIELVVLAVRGADSRQAAALRYARALQAGIPARFTSRAGHDTCYRALDDVVALAQTHPAVTALTVLGRNGQALLRQESGSPPHASAALAAERSRPYTETEARRFLTLHQGLLRALPQHRAELEEIAALARPMMPAAVRPPQLERPHPVLRHLPTSAAAAPRPPVAASRTWPASPVTSPPAWRQPGNWAGRAADTASKATCGGLTVTSAARPPPTVPHAPKPKNTMSPASVPPARPSVLSSCPSPTPRPPTTRSTWPKCFSRASICAPPP